MAEKIKVLAFDFGASSGRAMLCSFEDEKITLDEIHRFSNDPVLVSGSFRWDILRLFHEIKQGILKCVNLGHKDVSAIGIDTWGVDYALFDSEGSMLSNPYHYRDSRTDGMQERAIELVGREEIFNTTGIQFNFFNTIFQILSMVEKDDPALKVAKKLLFTPDIFNYFLTGVMKNEYTIASTSQLLDAKSRTWSKNLIEKMGIPFDIFGEIIEPGTIIGKLSQEICDELGCPEIPVVAVGAHDTASAVASVPVVGADDYAYISSGTWALMGIEANEPIINEKSMGYNFTNEGGVNGKIRFLKNIMGLWIIQECRRQWQKEGNELSFDQLENAAWIATPFESLIDPDNMAFAAPGNMPKRIREFCEKTGQKVPQTEGEITRCVAQSLAFKCRMTLDALEETLDKRLNTIHMVGGGIKDTMVCQFIANACYRDVVAGPIEATATGNAIVQLMALGKIDGLDSARKVVKNSFDLKMYKPQDGDKWQEAYKTFKGIAKF